MSKLEKLKQRVAGLYESNRPGRDDWAGWLWQYHVPVVAKNAHDVAVRVGANAELSEAAAWLHDIADVAMSRLDDRHEAESLNIARQIMHEAGYSGEDIATVVDDALPLHSCRDGKRPRLLEGKVLATADALAHLKTDFYVHAAHAMDYDMTLAQLKNWTVKKAARDFNDKICFDEIREETRADYEIIHNLFSR